jgi:hypothetical protein
MTNTTTDFMGYTVIASGADEGRFATIEVAIQAHVDECHSWISDASKDAQGFRCRMDVSNLTFEQLDAECDYWADAANAAADEEAILEAECVEEFKKLVQETIALGAGDEVTALRWLTQDEEFYHSQDVESWVYNHGILFTPYGKELVAKLRDIVQYKEVA